MTFKEWITNYAPAAENLTPTDIQLIEIGWIAAKVDAATEKLDEALEREAA